LKTEDGDLIIKFPDFINDKIVFIECTDSNYLISKNIEVNQVENAIYDCPHIFDVYGIQKREYLFLGKEDEV
jgi:hypothetical protein